MALFNLFRKKRGEELKKDIDRKLDRRRGDREIEELRSIVEEDNLRDDFFSTLFEMEYTKSRSRKKQLLSKAKSIAKKIPEFAGWPESSKFWDVEALAWIVKIPEKVRKFIKSEIADSVPKKGLNLSLGCGSYPYAKNSVLVDFSEEMLRSAGPEYREKVLFDLESGSLPFKSYSFDSATMVFVINYIKSIEPLFKEVRRVLKEGGKLIIVQSAEQIAEFYRLKEKRQWKQEEIEKMMRNAGFKTDVRRAEIGRTRLLIFEGTRGE